jgi:hypothetical protein
MFISLPRVVTGNSAASTALNLASTVIMDSLRNALNRKSRYIVVPRDSSASVLAVTRNTDSIARLTHAEMFASLAAQQAGSGFVTWMMTLRDLTAQGSSAIRSVSIRVPADSMLNGTDSLIARSVRMFEELDRAPRRVALPPG